jgi:hypothetical protein
MGAARWSGHDVLAYGTASGCDQHLNPLPWLVAGAALVVAGFVAHARRT